MRDGMYVVSDASSYTDRTPGGRNKVGRSLRSLGIDTNDHDRDHRVASIEHREH